MEFDQIVQIIALTLGIAWASGINLYAALLVPGLLGATGQMSLPPDLQILSDPIVLWAAAIMFVIEFVADKIPGVDSAWDTVHTFIRIPAGALLAVGAIGDVSPAVMTAAGIVGGSLAAASHLTKAGTRLIINASPEPFSNWFASISEDILAVVVLFLALYFPWLFFGFFLVILLLTIWFLPRVWRGLKALFTGLARRFDRGDLHDPHRRG
jgi:hypothetical protein